jgi:hypothetical protein
VLTDARIGHGDVEIRIGKRGGYDLKAAQIPIDWYYRTGKLGDMNTEDGRDEARTRYAAANKFYKDFALTGMMKGMTIDYNKVYSVDKRAYLPATQTQREALDRWRAAYQSVSGVVGKMMAVNVCCYAHYVRELQNRYHKRSQDAFPRFLEVLDDLVAHYFIDMSDRNR